MSQLTDLENGQTSRAGSADNRRIDPTTMASPNGLITPAYEVTVVSGANAITGIVIPYDSFQGEVTFLPTGAFTWTNATNIAVAGTAVVSRQLKFQYNPVTAKWYPSYV